MKDIRQLEEKELQEFIAEKGEKSFRSSQILEWLWKKSEVDFSRMSNLPAGLRDSLAENFRIQSIKIMGGNIRRV